MPEPLFKVGNTWYARVLGPDGKIVRRSTKCRDKKAAEEARRRFEREAADPAHHAAHKTTLASALARFLDDRRDRGKAAGTIDMYVKKGRHLLRGFPDAALADITAQSVDKYIALRRADGAHPSSIGKEFSTLRGTLKLAKRRGEWGGDVDAVMPVGWSNQYEPKTRFLSAEEAPRLLAAFPDYRAAHLCFILATGARLSEAARAQRGDVDMVGRTVAMRGSKTKKSKASVPVLGLAEVFLRFALAHAPGKDGEPLFARWTGIRWDLTRVCDRLGMPRVSPNDLRRTLASWLRQRGAAVGDIAGMLRHADSRMVERVYGQLSAVDLGRLLEGKAGGQSIFSPEPVEKTGSVGSPGDAASVETSENFVPGDGIEPPTRGFSRPGLRPDSSWNPRYARGSQSNLSSEGRARSRELAREVRAGRALRNGVKAALAGDLPATRRAMHRAGVAMGVITRPLPRAARG